MKISKFYSLLVLVLVAFISKAQVPFTAGNFVVYRVGNGYAALSSAAAPVFLDEYTSTGTLVQSIALPTAVNGSNQLLTSRPSTNFEGMINLSADGKYLVIAGDNTTLGTTSYVNSTIGLVDYNAAINTSTVILNNSQISSATSTNGTNLWFIGSGSTTGKELGYTTIGNSTTTVLDNTISGKHINAIGNQLIVSTSTSSVSLATVGSNLPTTAGQTYAVLPGMPSTTGLMQFAFADLDPTVAGVDVLYVPSIGTPGGIIKYSLVGGIWVNNGNIGVASDRYQGLTIKKTGTAVTIFATRGGPNSSYRGGELVSLTDNSGYNATLTGTPTVLASIATRFGAADVAAFRGLALVPQSSSVPVTLSNLKGVKNQDKNILSWGTLTEINNKGFDIERSADGRNFSTIASVDSKAAGGNSNALIEYSFTDNKVLLGNSFYRLKQVDKDGSFHYSNVVNIKNDRPLDAIVEVYPNPVKEVLNISFNSISSDKITLTICDMNGKAIQSLNTSVIAGSNNIKIDLPALAKGVYLLKVNCSSGLVIEGKKIIKQ